MMHFDALAHKSPLRRSDPREKLFQVLLALGVILWSSETTIPLMILTAVMGILVGINKTPILTVIKAMMIPIGFLVLGTFTILFHQIPVEQVAIWSVTFGDANWGVTQQSMIHSTHVAAKAIASISCLYYLILTTPMPALCHGLGKLGCPKLIIELMQLMYLMIFLLFETTTHIYCAQKSRLGYSSFSGQFRELGVLASMTFVRAIKRADALYTALEARGYDGTLNDYEVDYETSVWGYVLPVFVIILILWMN